MADTETSSSSRWRGALKIIGVLVFAWVVVQAIDVGEALVVLAKLSAPVVGVAVLVHLAVIGLMTLRWHILIHGLDRGLPFGTAFKLTAATTVFNLTLPTSVGGDVWRVWAGRRYGIDASTGSAIALADRLIGLVVLVIYVAAAALVLPGALPLSPWLTLLIPVAMILGLWALARLPMPTNRWPMMAMFRDAMSRALSGSRRLGMTMMLSLVMQVMTGVIAWQLTQDLTQVDPGIILVFPATVLVGLIPLSVGGWGMREVTAIIILQPLGLTHEVAVVVTLVFGLTQLAAGLIGWGGGLYLASADQQ